jgi:hypothetical protein
MINHGPEVCFATGIASAITIHCVGKLFSTNGFSLRETAALSMAATQSSFYIERGDWKPIAAAAVGVLTSVKLVEFLDVFFRSRYHGQGTLFCVLRKVHVDAENGVERVQSGEA